MLVVGTKLHGYTFRIKELHTQLRSIHAIKKFNAHKSLLIVPICGSITLNILIWVVSAHMERFGDLMWH